MEGGTWFPYEVFIVGILFTIATYVLIKISKRSLHHDLRARDISKGHHWSYSGGMLQVTYKKL